MSIRGPDLQFVVTMSNTEWKARANRLVYELSLRNVHAHLRLPLRHPLASLCDTGLEAQMFYATNVSVRGTKLYHYKYNADYRDSHAMVFTLDGVEVEAAGHYARYFLSLYNNYAGDNHAPPVLARLRAGRIPQPGLPRSHPPGAGRRWCR